MRRLALGMALGVAALLPGAALAHGGNPNYRSEFGSLRPAVSGLEVQVLNYDDRLLLINRTGKTVLLEGYEHEPYARLQADGTVEVNKRSPSYFLNEERYGGTPVPKSAGPDAQPQWTRVSGTGRFETHDHRIHWMSKEARPPQVTDADRRTRVFDWRVPIEVGPRRAAITGTLFWEPDSGGGVPAAAIIALGVLVALTVGLFWWTRRLRARGAASSAR